jgi:outer membrane protein assembly factor BamD (BamD/ComL family)
VAVKEEDNAASDIYNRAGASLQAGKYEDAAASYTQAEARFIVVTQTAAEKRREAEEALTAAEQKMKESDETAKKAELLLGGGAL